MKKYYVKYWDRFNNGFKTQKFTGREGLENWLNTTYPKGLGAVDARFARPMIVYGEEIYPTELRNTIQYKVR